LKPRVHELAAEGEGYMNPEVVAYIEALSGQRRVMVEKLVAIVLAVCPQAGVSMKYRMPTFTAGEAWVAVANQKNYVSLYTCDQSHIRAFRERHPSIGAGKGCINFRERDPLPEADIRAVVDHAISHPKGG
jgi:uncharacterized protein YdhG (YjbR/CyaY superfamily)